MPRVLKPSFGVGASTIFIFPQLVEQETLKHPSSSAPLGCGVLHELRTVVACRVDDAARSDSQTS
eukprot:14413558-Alexandrium_andersonii.AAC.1